MVNAPAVWALGFTGQGIVVGGQDTGYEWNHPALISSYRGWNGTTADHNYNWHDAIHIADPPAIYASALTVGSTTSNDSLSGFSGRGPVTVDGSNRLKPDISAPGSSVRSSVPGGGYGLKSGTSMASPNVAGVTALLLSANPALAGQPANVRAVLTGSAVPKTTSQDCGTIPGSQSPNNSYGWGRIDALAAVQSQPGNDLIFTNGFD